MGAIQPDAYSNSEQEVIHVLNVYFTSPESRAVVAEFIYTKALWYTKHLPNGTKQVFHMDLRGQQVGFKTMDDWRDTLLNQMRFELPDYPTQIDFLID